VPPPPIPVAPPPPMPPPLPAAAPVRQGPSLPVNRPTGPTRACPNCSLPLSTKARFCRRCGAPQPT
jgi:hypothetical protein